MTEYKAWPGLIEAYRDRMPVGDDWTIVTLLEGRRRWCGANHPSEVTGCEGVSEGRGLNPTGSFKDRGMTMAVTTALNTTASARSQCASTGNTSASAAAYATRAGMTCAVLIPEGKIAMGKLAQAVMAGATIVQVQGNFDDCLELARKVTADFPEIELVNSVNPARSKVRRPPRSRSSTSWAAPRRARAAGRQRRQHHRVLEGYTEYRADGRCDSLPRMLGVAGRRRTAGQWRPVAGAETIATAIRIGSPASWNQAVAAKEESGGMFRAATDEKLLEAYRLVAGRDGVFVEPASAASVAGPTAARADGWIEPGSTVVCTVTGNGLKDPDTALLGMPEVAAIPADPGAVAQALGGRVAGDRCHDDLLPAGLRVGVRVPASSANLGPGFRLPRPRAGDLRRPDRDDDR